MLEGSRPPSGAASAKYITSHSRNNSYHYVTAAMAELAKVKVPQHYDMAT
jgi:hypothetical protein